MNTLKKRVNQRGQGGFTLIELLVVIAILAILAGVVVFAVGKSTTNAEVSACKVERASIITAFQAAKTSNLTSPTNNETYLAYLSNPDDLSYFAKAALDAAATTPADITPTGKNHTGPAPAGCNVITAAQIS